MRPGDRVGYSQQFLDLLPKNRKHHKMPPAAMRGHLKRVSNNMATVHWDDGNIRHHHPLSIEKKHR